MKYTVIAKQEVRSLPFEVEANSREEAEEKAQEIVDRGEAEPEHELGDQAVEFEIDRVFSEPIKPAGLPPINSDTTCGHCGGEVSYKDPWNCPEANHGYYCGSKCVNAHMDLIHADLKRLA